MDNPITPHLRGRIEPVQQLEALGKQWRELEEYADCSFFVSWSWIGPWLQTFQHHAKLSLYQCWLGDKLIALGVFDLAVVTRRRIVRSRVLAMNEIASKDFNMHIEYNGLLIRHGYENLAWPQLIEDLHNTDAPWDELYITAVGHHTFHQLQSMTPRVRVLCDKNDNTWLVDLHGLAGKLDNLMERISPKRRWQIRRSMKEYEKHGELNIEQASNKEQALAFFKAMAELHSLRWQAVGKPGSFANPHWVAFHQTLIDNAFARGEAQLLRISCGNESIGYLYNFIWRNRVYGLQSGFKITKEKNKQPGFISYCLAIVLNSTQGLTTYDFMSGTGEYKHLLCDAGGQLFSCRIQKPRLKFYIEEVLVAFIRKLRSLNKLRERAYQFFCSLGISKAHKKLMLVLYPALFKIVQLKEFSSFGIDVCI